MTSKDNGTIGPGSTGKPDSRGALPCGCGRTTGWCIGAGCPDRSKAGLFCPKCRGRVFAVVDERKADGSFGPGPERRCVDCKHVIGPLAASRADPERSSPHAKDHPSLPLPPSEGVLEQIEGALGNLLQMQHERAYSRLTKWERMVVDDAAAALDAALAAIQAATPAEPPAALVKLPTAFGEDGRARGPEYQLAEPPEAAWLIERDGQWYAAAPHSRWTTQQALDGNTWRENWTADANRALRFSRKCDAETLIQYEGLQNAVATEHIWMDARERKA